MNSFKTQTFFDHTFVERPIDQDDFMNAVAHYKKESETCLDTLLLSKIKLRLGEYNRVLSKYDEAEELLLSSYENFSALKLKMEYFLTKCCLGYLFYNKQRYFKCDEFLLKCIEMTSKIKGSEKNLPKIYLYLAMNKFAQREVRSCEKFILLGIESSIEHGELSVLEDLKRYLNEKIKYK